MKDSSDGRRDVTSRNTKWAYQVARFLVKSSITPNQISILSVVFSVIGGGVLLWATQSTSIPLYLALIIYILCIQLRLLCNLFDGMVAIEGGKKSQNGDLYNDIPDRFSDALLIIPAGYFAGGLGVELGWMAALLAVMTAYFRWIGAFKTQNHFFNGPMAKQHRMALLTIAAILGLCTLQLNYYRQLFMITLIIMNIGLIITLLNRLYHMSHPAKNS